MQVIALPGSARHLVRLDGTAPDDTAPDDTAPDGTAPDGTAPDGTAPDGIVAPASAADIAEVRLLLGRRPQGAFVVVVRDGGDGTPAVIRNDPLLDDGTPMPTRFWLVDPDVNRRIGTLESAGGVRTAEAEVDADELAHAHRRYAAERDAALPAGHTGPVPSGGVGGTRTGVKCLHTHYAWWLAGGDDPVGAWVHDHLAG